jgi:hypothetical protein
MMSMFTGWRTLPMTVAITSGTDIGMPIQPLEP